MTQSDHMTTADPLRSPKAQARPLDGLAFLGFLLSLFVMVLPLEADVVFVLLQNRQFFRAGAFAAACFAVVCTPFALSLRRRKREPRARRGRGYLVATGIILALNVLFVGTIFMYQLFR